MDDREKDDYIAQLESIIAAMPGNVFWKSKNGTYLGCNRQVAKLFGLASSSEIAGKTTEELVGEELASALLINDEEVMATGKEFYAEEIGPGHNNDKATYLTKKAPLRNAAGEITGLIGISFDISERKKIEEELKQTEEKLKETSLRLENILSLIPGHVYWKDINGYYLGCNETFAKTLNLSSRADIIGKHDTDFISKELAKPVIAVDQEVIRNNVQKTIEELAIDKNGNPAIYLSQKTPLKDSFGNIIGLVGVSVDITERKKIEDQLNKTQEELEKVNKEKTKFIENMSYLESVFAWLPGNVYWKDRSGKYLGCNDNAAKLIGLKSRFEIVNKTLYDFLDKELAATIFKIDEEVMASGVTKTLEESAFDLEGNPAVYLTHKVPLYNEEGKVLGMLGISLDISERIKIEQALKEAKERAEAANKAKTEFLAMISHELRIPLTGILGMAQLLDSDENLSPEQQAETSDIIKAGEHLLELVDDLLDITKLEAGKVELHPTPVNLKKLVEEIGIMLTPKTKEKNIELLVEYDENIPHRAIADARAIRQILLNLVGNAIKFTKIGYVTIRVHYKNDSGKNNFIFAVEDTGIGIPEDKLISIFERFNQADTSITRQYGGTGLGLTICKAYVELMNGSINVQSKLGKGSLFSFTIPLQLDSNTMISSPWNPYKFQVRILIVGESLRTEVLAKHIASPLCQVISSEHALNSLLAAQKTQHPFNIVIIEQQIKNIELHMLMQNIHKHIVHYVPMLLLLTTDNSSNLKTNAQEIGFFDCLVNPVGPTELLTTLTALWEKWSEKFTAPKALNKPLKILLVEDDPIITKVHKTMLEKLNCTVETADSGKKVLAIFKNNFDLIFMDIGLPDISGYDITAEIRQYEASNNLPHTPIIGLTGYAQEEFQMKCLASGMDEVATKPTELKKLEQILLKYM